MKIRHQASNPYPKALSDGSTIIDERCSCGKLCSEHADTFQFGHGAAPGCERFSWVGYVFNIPPEHRRIDDRHSVTFAAARKRSVGAKGIRYQVWDCLRGKLPRKLFNTVATAARSASDAYEHAMEEMRHWRKRQAADAS